ncbi:MAG TPA: hypothetical protein VJV39_23150 [Dongiaceae bacterium]|nr:hypothetical protein [Dongiaceae bacterium]
MRLMKAAVFALIGGPLAMLIAHSARAAECAENDERFEYADVAFRIPNANDLYRHTFDEVGLHFAPQTFVGDRRVPSESYYDANGTTPVDGTYVVVSIKPPRVGQLSVQRYERMKGTLNEAIAAHPGESTFEDGKRTTKVQFRRLDGSTIVATQIVAEDSVLVSESWLHLDGTDKIKHILRCEYFVVRSATLPDLPMECTSWFPVGTSIATVQLRGGKQERSYRLSRQVRDDIEGFIEPGTNP